VTNILLKNLTVIIPSLNRHKYIRRSVAYWRDINVRVLIVDSSINPYRGTFPKNIEYLHMPNSLFSKKVSFAIRMIKTPFTVLCPDDDFQTELGLQACVSFLDGNPNYSAALGQQFIYSQVVEGHRPLYLNGRYTDINDLDIFVRIKKSFEKYVVWFWAVHKTQVISAIFSKHEYIDSGNLLELGICFGSISAGYHKELPIVYQFREELPGSWGRRAESLSALKNGGNLEVWRESLQSLSQELSNLNVDDSEKAYQLMHTSYNKFKIYSSSILARVQQVFINYKFRITFGLLKKRTLISGREINVTDFSHCWQRIDKILQLEKKL